MEQHRPVINGEEWNWGDTIPEAKRIVKLLEKNMEHNRKDIVLTPVYILIRIGFPSISKKSK